MDTHFLVTIYEEKGKSAVDKRIVVYDVIRLFRIIEQFEGSGIPFTVHKISECLLDKS